MQIELHLTGYTAIKTTNQAESHRNQPFFLKVMLSLVAVAIPYYRLHGNCMQLEGKYL